MLGLQAADPVAEDVGQDNPCKSHTAVAIACEAAGLEQGQPPPGRLLLRPARLCAGAQAPDGPRGEEAVVPHRAPPLWQLGSRAPPYSRPCPPAYAAPAGARSAHECAALVRYLSRLALGDLGCTTCVSRPLHCYVEGDRAWIEI